MLLLSIFSDGVVPVAADPLAGWAGLILQGGAFGLLVYIIVFLVPKAMKDAKEERASRDKVFTDLVMMLQAKFEVRNDKIVEALSSQTKELSAAMKTACQASLFHPDVRRRGTGPT